MEIILIIALFYGLFSGVNKKEKVKRNRDFENFSMVDWLTGKP